jgi:hypothetical protein
MRYLTFVSAALALVSVSCGRKNETVKSDPNAFIVGCDSLQGQYVMDDKSCTGYYSTLLPALGRPYQWITLSAGDSVKIEQKSCDSVKIGSSITTELEDFSPGVAMPKSDGYSGSISRSLISRELVVKETKWEGASGAKRTIKFSLDADKNLLIDLDSVSGAFPFGPTKLQSKCTLKRVPASI